MNSFTSLSVSLSFAITVEEGVGRKHPASCSEGREAGGMKL